MRRIKDYIMEAAEYYGIGELLIRSSNIPRAVDARAMVATRAYEDGYTYADIERGLGIGKNTAGRLAGKERAFYNDGVQNGHSVVYDILDTMGRDDEGVGNWTRNSTQNNVALALLDSGWNETSIELHIEIPDSRTKYAAEIEGGLLDDGTIRFDRYSWLKKELTPVWVIGRYPGYTTNHPPMGEFEPDKNHHYVWMEGTRYQIYKPSITRRFVDEGKEDIDEAAHVGWYESWD